MWYDMIWCAIQCLMTVFDFGVMICAGRFVLIRMAPNWAAHSCKLRWCIRDPSLIAEELRKSFIPFLHPIASPPPPPTLYLKPLFPWSCMLQSNQEHAMSETDPHRRAQEGSRCITDTEGKRLQNNGRSAQRCEQGKPYNIYGHVRQIATAGHRKGECCVKRS